MRRVDREALQRAIDKCMADPIRLAQVSRKLAEEGFRECGEFCAYVQQMRNLRLKPWQVPPCWRTASDTPNPVHAALSGEAEAIELCKRLRAAGLSRYEPDPLAALDL